MAVNINDNDGTSSLSFAVAANGGAAVLDLSSLTTSVGTINFGGGFTPGTNAGYIDSNGYGINIFATGAGDLSLTAQNGANVGLYADGNISFQPGTGAAFWSFNPDGSFSDSSGAVGSSGDVLTSSGAGPATWQPASGASPLTTKGDVYTFSTVNARLPVGTNGQVITADSAQTLGIKWATPAAGTPAGSDTQVQFNDSGSFGANAAFLFNKNTTNPVLTLAGSGVQEVRLYDTSSTAYGAITGSAGSISLFSQNSQRVNIHAATDIQFSNGGSLPFVYTWINVNGAIGFGSTPDYGTSGQVITSNGSGSPASWTTPSGTTGQNEDVLFATASQTVFNTTNAATTTKFGAGTKAFIGVYVNGVRQREDNSSGTAYATPGNFYVSGANQITFFTGLAVNDEVTVDVL